MISVGPMIRPIVPARVENGGHLVLTQRLTAGSRTVGWKGYRRGWERRVVFIVLDISSRVGDE